MYLIINTERLMLFENDLTLHCFLQLRFQKCLDANQGQQTDAKKQACQQSSKVTTASMVTHHGCHANHDVTLPTSQRLVTN